MPTNKEIAEWMREAASRISYIESDKSDHVRVALGLVAEEQKFNTRAAQVEAMEDQSERIQALTERLSHFDRLIAEIGAILGIDENAAGVDVDPTFGEFLAKVRGSVDGRMCGTCRWFRNIDDTLNYCGLPRTVASNMGWVSSCGPDFGCRHWKRKEG